MDELKRIYRQAMGGRIRALEAALATLASSGDDASETIRRVAHSLRGSGATYGFPEVSAAAAAAEDATPETLGQHTEQLLTVLRTVAGENAAARILAVDDDPEIQLLLRYMLANSGRELVVAGTAAEAQDLLVRERFDLILLDLMLPDADGRKLLLSIRELPTSQNTPVFVLSGKNTSSARTECFALGADGFFEKPFDPELITSAVDALLRRGRAQADAAPVRNATAGVDAPILVVEDDPLVASILRHRLERDGFRIVHCKDGVRALDAIARGDLALAILDVKLPGVDGFELLGKLRATPGTASVPVIMLTALGNERDVVRGLSLGADDYMLKPFSPVELLARVHRLLGR